MKLKSLFKILLAITISSVAITSIVLFSNVNTIRLPSVKILDKNTYNDILKKQNLSKAPSINYYSLANSNESILDIATANTPHDNYFFFIGSDSYNSTSKALYGWDESVPLRTYNDPVNFGTSLMLNLYDLFFNDANYNKLKDYGIENVNPVFYSYVDISLNKNTINGEQLLNERAYNMKGSFYPNGAKEPQIGTSNVWRIGDDVANPKYESVVSTTTYNYEPILDSYYEFRPNDGEDTKYEKVYFRDQELVRNYENVSNFLSNYGDRNNFTVNRTGTLLAVKKDGNSNSYLAITDFNLSINKMLIDIIKFFNPDSTLSENDNVVDEGNDSSGTDGDTSQDSKPSSFKRSYSELDYSYDVIDQCFSTMNNITTNIIPINSKNY